MSDKVDNYLNFNISTEQGNTDGVMSKATLTLEYPAITNESANQLNVTGFLGMVEGLVGAIDKMRTAKAGE